MKRYYNYLEKERGLVEVNFLVVIIKIQVCRLSFLFFLNWIRYQSYIIKGFQMILYEVEELFSYILMEFLIYKIV